MPFSDPENKPYAMQIIEELQPATVLDVGAGAGVYADLIRETLSSPVHITGSEIWEPYIYQYRLLKKYNAVSLEDIRDRWMFKYDLVIFGDVLEHMPMEDAVDVWNIACHQAGVVILSIPTIHYPQGEEYGNPHEAHITDDWTVEKILETFDNITAYQTFDVTGVFVADSRK